MLGGRSCRAVWGSWAHTAYRLEEGEGEGAALELPALRERTGLLLVRIGGERAEGRGGGGGVSASGVVFYYVCFFFVHVCVFFFPVTMFCQFF